MLCKKCRSYVLSKYLSQHIFTNIELNNIIPSCTVSNKVNVIDLYETDLATYYENTVIMTGLQRKDNLFTHIAMYHTTGIVKLNLTNCLLV